MKFVLSDTALVLFQESLWEWYSLACFSISPNHPKALWGLFCSSLLPQLQRFLLTYLQLEFAAFSNQSCLLSTASAGSRLLSHISALTHISMATASQYPDVAAATPKEKRQFRDPVLGTPTHTRTHACSDTTFLS